MRTLEWDNMGVKIEGQRLHHLRFADDIVFITPNISQAKRKFDDFDKPCGKIGLRLNLTKALSMMAYSCTRQRKMDDLLAPTRVTR
ncbi:unnamed protein product [Angiostrongylus costaricensis]|uniref:Reverse transcriptase domain-containing protein n=1 Tax=Angiostrongylus costaricensis TaxID=334426 RepID=A0A0R3PFH5_ANGCS|nr:unnamed protein product [Angiostrongylus costaricensis]